MKPTNYITKYHFWTLLSTILGLAFFIGSLAIKNNTKTYMILMDMPFLWISFAISLWGFLSLKKENPYLWTNFRLVVISIFINIILHVFALGLFNEINNSIWTFIFVAIGFFQLVVIVCLSGTGHLRTTSYARLKRREELLEQQNN